MYVARELNREEKRRYIELLRFLVKKKIALFLLIFIYSVLLSFSHGIYLSIHKTERDIDYSWTGLISSLRYFAI